MFKCTFMILSFTCIASLVDLQTNTDSTFIILPIWTLCIFVGLIMAIRAPDLMYSIYSENEGKTIIEKKDKNHQSKRMLVN